MGEILTGTPDPAPSAIGDHPSTSTATPSPGLGRSSLYRRQTASERPPNEIPRRFARAPDSVTKPPDPLNFFGFSALGSGRSHRGVASSAGVRRSRCPFDWRFFSNPTARPPIRGLMPGTLSGGVAGSHSVGRTRYSGGSRPGGKKRRPAPGRGRSDSAGAGGGRRCMGPTAGSRGSRRGRSSLPTGP